LRFSQEAIRKLGLNLLHKTTLMKHFILTLGLLSTALAAQTDSLQVEKPKIEIKKAVEIINPAKKFYVGAEIGLDNKQQNVSKGLSLPSYVTSSAGVQFGVSAELYFARHWSISTKLKYYQTQLYYGDYYYDIDPETNRQTNGKYSYTMAKAHVLSMPFNLKWEFRVADNLAASLKLGFVYNIEISSSYDPEPKYIASSSSYSTGLYGLGVNYFLNKKWAVYADYESIPGPSKGKTTDFFSSSYHANNTHLSLGVKYSIN
jgi:Outer membrane protein beta-barrel domain